jgi:hypothetical protein
MITSDTIIDEYTSGILALRRDDETMQSFVSDVFESARDGVVEFYEFIDAILVMRSLRSADTFSRRTLSSTMQGIRKGRCPTPDRLWTWSEDGECSDLETYHVWKSAFRRMDVNHDGVLDKSEIF